MATVTSPKLQRVQRLVEQADDLPTGGIDGWKERARLAVASAYGEGSSQLERFDEIRWSLSMWSSSTPQSMFDRAKRGGLRSAVQMLEAIAEDLEEIDQSPSLPEIDLSSLHPWIVDAASRLWHDGHRRQAVQTAATSVENWLRAKTQVHQGSVASLVGSAFSPANPTEKSPRLRFPDTGPIDSDAWKSAHEGAAAFGRGCFLRIRNLYTHQNGETEQVDLEALAALSLLARWIDEAELVNE